VSLPEITAADLPRLAYAHGKDHDPALTQPEKFRPVVNSSMFVKPEAGGLWTAPVTREDPGSGRILATDWTAWCRSEDYGLDRCTDFVEIAPEPGFQGLIIDGQTDLDAIHQEYGIQNKLVAHWAVLDWERMAGDGVDGLFLTHRGQYETRFSDLSIYGWDTACVLWIRPAYRVVS
jgi:hypothetical protein